MSFVCFIGIGGEEEEEEEEEELTKFPDEVIQKSGVAGIVGRVETQIEDVDLHGWSQGRRI